MSNELTFAFLRHSKNLTQEALSGLSGVATATIRKIERGETQWPQRISFDALRHALNVDADTLNEAILNTYNSYHKITSDDGSIITTDDYNKQYKVCEDIFKTLASQNANCDITLFHELFLDLMPLKMRANESQLRLSTINLAIKTVRGNIIDVLDAVVELFAAMTGQRCAACLQLMSSTPDSVATVTIVERDKWSARDRSIGSRMPVEGNTINEFIFQHGHKQVIIDDFRKAVLDNNIKTTYSTAGKLYNAIFIVAVPNIRSDHELEGYKVISTLCVDSQSALRQDRKDVCLHFASELAFRIGTMYYRLERLVHQHELLNSQIRGGGQ